MLNKKAGYNRHTLCLPINVQKAFEKMKMFFFSKKPSSSKLSFFPLFKVFWFLPLKPPNYGGRLFQEIEPFDTHSTTTLPPLAILNRIQIFSEQPI